MCHRGPGYGRKKYKSDSSVPLCCPEAGLNAGTKTALFSQHNGQNCESNRIPEDYSLANKTTRSIICGMTAGRKMICCTRLQFLNTSQELPTSTCPEKNLCNMSSAQKKGNISAWVERDMAE